MLVRLLTWKTSQTNQLKSLNPARAHQTVLEQITHRVKQVAYRHEPTNSKAIKSQVHFELITLERRLVFVLPLMRKRRKLPEEEGSGLMWTEQ